MEFNLFTLELQHGSGYLHRFFLAAEITARLGPEHVAVTAVLVDDPEDLIGYSEIIIIDDNTRGSSGNGNCIAEAGETIGLDIVAKNYGNVNQQNFRISAASEGPWVGRILGHIDFDELQPGEQGYG